MREALLTNDFNTEFVLTDAHGNRKKLWQENRLGRMLRLAGCELRVPGITGNKSDVLRNHNLVTSAGKAAAAGRLSGQGSYSTFTNIAIGTGAVAAAAGDTALGTEITTGGGARGAATPSQVTTTVANDTARLTKTFTFTAPFAVTEEGILDSASTGGTLFARQVFAAINVASGDSLTITHSYSIG